ncbi:expressed protein [Phakopsora pachyrhizi]|uniref:Expressed protein n=1 Tax=Phakopsora pachyrhizi TaxID=170000 RepID=A0AAV0B588_PHAPC|nr:expressed protein [Phakopsora pachyrhizi]
MITGSSTEVVLWDLTTEPICLGCFGRRMVPRNPYSPLMVRLETINNLCEQPRKLIAEFEDHSIASWDLRDIIPQHHHHQQQQQQVKKLRTTQPEVISGDRSKTGWAFSCCDDMAHRYQIDSEGTIRNLDSQADLANLLEPVELFVCLNCNHQTDELNYILIFKKIKVDFLVLKRRTGEILTVRTKLSKKIGNSDEERFTIKLVKSNCSDDYYTKVNDNQLLIILKDQLNKNFSFHPKLRLPIYKRILSIANDSRLVNEYFNGLSKPNPTEFLKKFRFEWKLEEPKFQFSLETLLTIFRGTKRYTDDLLIDRLSPILYSFLNIFQSAPTEQRSKRQQATPYESYHQEVDLTNINDDGDDETELEIYIVCNKLLNNENGRIFLEEDRWKAFVEDIERCLLDEPSGRKILKLFDDLKISFGKDVLYSLTYGFFMGFTTPKTFA